MFMTRFNRNRLGGLSITPDGGEPAGGGGGGTPQAGAPVSPNVPLPNTPTGQTQVPPLVAPDAAFEAAFSPAQREARQGQQAPQDDRYTQLMNAFEEERSRRSGLDRRYTEWEQRLSTLGEQLTQLTHLVQGNQAQGGQPPPDPSPARQPQRQQPASPPDDDDDIHITVAQLQAERERTRAIRNVAREFPGVDLWQWEENITLHPGDPEAQRTAVREIAERLQQQQSGAAQQAADQRQQALTQGMTPGSSPSPPQTPEDQGLARTQEIWEMMNDIPRWMALSETERTQLEEEFDPLSQQYGYALGDGFQQGWPNMASLMSRVNELERMVRSGSADLGQAHQGQAPALPMRG